VDVVEVAAEAVRPLRREVLRDGRPEADVTFPTDDTGFHLAVLDDEGVVIGIASFFESPAPRRPGRVAWQLRGMAVAPVWQGRGVGQRLLDEAVRRLRALGVEVVWADGRDTALRFYERAGWVVEGEGYVTSTGLPHHTVVLDLA
jgi:GNAT superfamily N-acetyltransferase